MNHRLLSALPPLLLAGHLLSPMLVQAALQAHFKLDDGAIDPNVVTVVSAVSGHTGAFAGGTFPSWSTAEVAPLPASEGVSTASLTFVSPGGYVVTDYEGPAGSAARTFAAWVKSPASLIGSGAGNGTLLSYGGTANYTRFSLRVDPSNGGRLRLEIAAAAIVGTTVVADDQWHHVAVVVPEGATMGGVRLYVDGNLQTFTINTAPNQAINTSGTTGTIHPLHIGVSVHNFGVMFIGQIDEVRAYDEALSDGQILELVYGAGTAPAIGQQPAPATAVLGATNASASFSVGLSAGSPPIAYQWKRNGVALPGGTTQILTLQNITASDIGTYTVEVSNPSGSTVSTPATLSWVTPPIDPREQTVLSGRTATFTINLPADSTGYGYQWRKNGTDLAGATHPALSLPSASAADAADYSVLVTLGDQSAASTPAPLKVLPVPASPYAQAVLAGPVIAYWRLGEPNSASAAADQTTLHPGSLVTFLGNEFQTPGPIRDDADTAALFYGGNHIEVPYAPALHHPSGFTLEAWARPDDNIGRHSVICSRNQYLSSGYELASVNGVWQFRTGYATSPASEFWNDLSGGEVRVGEWQHLVATYDGTTKRLYVDGRLVGSQSLPVLPIAVPLRLGAGRTYQTPAADFFIGALDEVALYWQALSEDDVVKHYSIGKFGANTPPAILEEPVAQTRYAGGTAVLRVLAQGSYPLSYQWTKDGADLPGATQPALTLERLATSDQGNYQVKISNPAGAATSASVTLTVVPLTETGYRAIVMDDAPAAYFPLDDAEGSSAAAELYNFGAYEGLYNGSPLLQQPGATAATRSAVQFDGLSQSVVIPNYPELNFQGPCSLEAWINPALVVPAGAFGNIVAHGHGGSPTRELALRVSSGSYQITSYDGSSYGTSLAMPESDLNTWIHLVGTYDGAAWNLYRNGALAARTPSATGAFTVDADWAIGARGTGTERFFQGSIDEVAIYAYALSPVQVANHYLAATGQTVTLSLSRSGDHLTLAWNVGQLESAPSVQGPWQAIVGAISPLGVATSESAAFYRVRAQ